MDTLHLVLLGLVQGLTEFLPVSSSAHLVLLPFVAGWQDQGLVYDVAAHGGSLAAVIGYFRHDLQRIVKNCSLPFSAQESADSQLLWFICLASVPVGIAGLVFHDFISSTLRNPQVIAIASIFFGLVLLLADKFGRATRDWSQLRWRDALFIGLAQVLALVPGTSRSGITITMGLALGMDRQSASRFSFLLAIPVILAASAYESFQLMSVSGDIEWWPVLTVFAVSLLSAWLSIHFFLKLLARTGMLPYVLYRVLLGVVLLVMF